MDAPDLVLDLPVSPSSPEAAADMTAAERFALSNQCTLKKGAGRTGSPRSSPSPSDRGPKPPVKAKPVLQGQTPDRPPGPPDKGYKQTSF